MHFTGPTHRPRTKLALALHNREDIMYETVFSHPSKVELVRHALSLGYFIRLFFICTESPRINIERVADRFLYGGHTVPGDKVVNRYTRALLYGAEAMRLVQRGYLYDNTSSALEGKSAFRLIFRTIDGQENKLYMPLEDMPLSYRYFWDDYRLAEVSACPGVAHN